MTIITLAMLYIINLDLYNLMERYFQKLIYGILSVLLLRQT